MSTIPPPLPELPGVTTAEDILAGNVPTFEQSGDRILMIGEATRRIDDDDYRFSDGTGEIRIDISDSLEQMGFWFVAPTLLNWSRIYSWLDDLEMKLADRPWRS